MGFLREAPCKTVAVGFFYGVLRKHSTVLDIYFVF